MSRTWGSKEWKEKRAIYLVGKVCEVCGKAEKLVIHHPQKKNSLTNEEYASFEGAQVLCNRCHFAYHKGMHLCPTCKVKYTKNKYATCFNCQPESDFKTAVKRRHELIEVFAPCGDLVRITREHYDGEGTEDYCYSCKRFMAVSDCLAYMNEVNKV
jgi:hypothetical protein